MTIYVRYNTASGCYLRGENQGSTSSWKTAQHYDKLSDAAGSENASEPNLEVHEYTDRGYFMRTYAVRPAEMTV